MTNKNDNKIIDALLSDAADDLYPVDELLSNKQTDMDDFPELSADFQASMDAMFKQEHKKLERSRRVRSFPRIAAAIALFLLLASVMVNQTSAWKEPIYNFFFHNSSDGEKSKIEISEEDEDDEFSKYLPKYVPDGFELVKKEYNEQNNNYGIQYINQNKNLYFSIQIFVETNDLYLDLYLDLSDYTKTTYKLQDYYVDDNSIAWHKNEYTYYITSNLEQADLLKIADSIK
jgi:hypothetical protein